MTEEEKEEIELDIEAKYVGNTEKEFLSRVTYAECLYILTPENKYCDEIKKLSVLKLCEIIYKLQKENEELKKYEKYYEEMEEVNKKFISVDKIRAKIKSLEEKIHIVIPNGYNKVEIMNEFKNEGAVDILKELLEEE